MTTIIEDHICFQCRNYIGDFSCHAFPNGIPEKLLFLNKHDSPFPGDNGIQFEPIEEE